MWETVVFLLCMFVLYVNADQFLISASTVIMHEFDEILFIKLILGLLQVVIHISLFSLISPLVDPSGIKIEKLEETKLLFKSNVVTIVPDSSVHTDWCKEH